ncbi:phosphate permease, partial [Mycobacterium tuberculosis]
GGLVSSLLSGVLPRPLLLSPAPAARRLPALPPERLAPRARPKAAFARLTALPPLASPGALARAAVAAPRPAFAPAALASA